MFDNHSLNLVIVMEKFVILYEECKASKAKRFLGVLDGHYVRHENGRLASKQAG